MTPSSTKKTSDDGKKHRTGALLAWEQFSTRMREQLKADKPNQKPGVRQREIRRLWKKDPSNPKSTEK